MTPPSDSVPSTVLLDALREQVNGFPRLPGVYLMKDAAGKIIYVGKAKDLRARVKSYFLGGDGRIQIKYLLTRITSIDKIVTDTEHQALLLERDLIGKHKPRYNIRLKDDKAYLSIRLDTNAEWPRLELVRKREEDGARYFGPYSYSYELRNLLEIIKRTIPLRTCADTVFYNRQRPCLEYQIKRCAGPCCLAVDRDEYRRWVQQAVGILEGRIDPLLKELTRAMEVASEQLRFEDAAVFRDRIELLTKFKQGASLLSFKGEDRDVFGLFREERLASLVVLKVRSGRVVDSSSYAFSDLEISDEEILESSLTQFYEHGREIPEEIILPYALENISMVEQELASRRGKGVALTVPERGLKARLVKLAAMNAREHFSATFDAEARYREIARTLSLALELRQVPRRIECVDISNFQGSDTVGAIVSFFDGTPDRQAYRKYKIEGDGKPDDFAAINEVVGRRLDRGKQDGDLPDLLIIDGGPGQLAMALEARDALGAELEIVALAKMRTESAVEQARIERKPERIYREGVEEPLLLESTSEVTHFLQRIRDEVHRFVITFHRSTRARRVFRSVLDEIPGVGSERRTRLLRHYGSIAGIRRATAEEIATQGRMPLALARRIVEKLSVQPETPASSADQGAPDSDGRSSDE